MLCVLFHQSYTKILINKIEIKYYNVSILFNLRPIQLHLIGSRRESMNNSLGYNLLFGVQNWCCVGSESVIQLLNKIKSN